MSHREFHLVKSKNNGGIYRICSDKLKQEEDQWELVKEPKVIVEVVKEIEPNKKRPYNKKEK